MFKAFTYFTGDMIDVLNEYFKFKGKHKYIFNLTCSEHFKKFIDIYGVYESVSCYENKTTKYYLHEGGKTHSQLSVTDIYTMFEQCFTLDFFKNLFENHDEDIFGEYFNLNKIKEIIYPKETKYHFMVTFGMKNRVDFHSEEMRNKLHKIVDDYIDNFGMSKNEYKDLAMSIYDEK